MHRCPRERCGTGSVCQIPECGRFAAAEPEEIEEIVRPCGLGRSKARDISACMRMLRDKYDCNVPDDFDALLELPGVAAKVPT